MRCKSGKSLKLKKKVSIIGAGNWGTTLAVLLSRKGAPVELHSVFQEHNLKMKKERKNSLYLKGVRFPAGLKVNPSLKDTLNNQKIIIAIPVKFLRKILKRIKKENPRLSKKIFISVSKGIESGSLKRVSQIIKEELSTRNIAVLSGPNIAWEVLKGVPSTALIAASNKEVGRSLQVLFNTLRFRVYLSNDIVGVELGGALKNIIAIACGISDGLGFGTNTKAALVTRGLAEITRLGKRLGARPETFWGTSGLGDLVTTCFSSYSRNRFVGEQLGKGRSLSRVTAKMSMVAEGVETVKSAYKLSKKWQVEMPITAEVYKVLYKGKNPRRAVSSLMTRPLKSEKTS